MRKVVDADRKLIRFMEAEYELYDNVSVPTDSTLSISDILLAVMVNSQVNSAERVRRIWQCKHQIEQALAKIPEDTSLTDEHVPWDDLEALFDALCHIRGVGASEVTKILHKKRPMLIPIYDGAVFRPFDRVTQISHGGSKAAFIVRYMRWFRNILMRCSCNIQQIKNLPEMVNYPVSAVRLLGVLLWIECDSKGAYMSCPRCHSEEVIPIEYGLPTEEAYKEALAGKFYLGGCVLSPDNWYCPRCEKTWGRYQDE